VFFLKLLCNWLQLFIHLNRGLFVLYGLVQHTAEGTLDTALAGFLLDVR
jgi:hypothetical protein